jgi:integrase
MTRGIWKLTEQEVKTLPDGLHRDGLGLFLRVRNRGKSRSWAFRYTFNGEQKSLLSLGPYPRVGLRSARIKTQECNRLIDEEGKDPAEVKRDEHLSIEIKAGLAMKMTEIVDRYMDVHVSHLRSPFTRKTAANYCKWIIETIGDVPVRMVTSHMILERFKLVELFKEHFPTGKNLQTHLSVIFRLAKVPCQLKENPASWETLEPWLGKIARSWRATPHAALNYKDVGRFLHKLRRYQIHGTHGRPNSALWLEFLILSGVRSGEVRQATWSEIGGDDWHVPPDHRKSGDITAKVRTIPITKPMHDVLKEMERRYPNASDDDLTFPKPSGGLYGTGALADIIKLLKWEDKITAHGFRNTLTDWAEANGKDALLLERQFDHLPPGVRRHYSSVMRKESIDPTLELRRQMMEEWGEYCNRSAQEYADAVAVEPLSTKITNSRKK